MKCGNCAYEGETAEFHNGTVFRCPICNSTVVSVAGKINDPVPQQTPFSQEVNSNKCKNPFFSCLNNKDMLKTVADIQVGNEIYPICDCCWEKLSTSEEYQWNAPAEHEREKQLGVEWKYIKSKDEDDENLPVITVQ